VKKSMTKRLPGPDVTQEQLKTRSWWKGPELFVVIDDYDLASPGGGNAPFQPLAEFVPQAKDVGLHVVAVRRTGGANRALYDPVLGKLKEIASPGLIGNGSKAGPMPPGRGVMVSRKTGEQLIQVAWIPPE